MHVIYKNINRIYICAYADICKSQIVHLRNECCCVLLQHVACSRMVQNLPEQVNYCLTSRKEIFAWRNGSGKWPQKFSLQFLYSNLDILHFISSFIHSSIPLHCELVLYLSPKYTHSNSWKFCFTALKVSWHFHGHKTVQRRERASEPQNQDQRSWTFTVYCTKMSL